MALTKTQCLDQLTKIAKNPENKGLSDNEIVSLAWKNSDKTTCSTYFSSSDLKTTISNIKTWKTTSWIVVSSSSKAKTSTWAALTWSVQKQPWMSEKVTEWIKNGFTWTMLILWLTLISFFLYKFSMFLIRFVFDVTKVNKLIYLRIALPRWDSKLDRELQKDLAKDMKEKIGRMSQVYRSMHKLWETSFWDKIMKTIFHKPKISLGMHYEDGTMNFLISTYPEYQKTVESAFAAQFSEATIEEMGEFNFFKKKYWDIMPVYQTKDPVYPIRTYKQLEDDPLNNIIDSIWKVSTDDTFTIFMTLKPEDASFNNRARKVAEGLYKRTIKYNEEKSILQKIPVIWLFFTFIKFLMGSWKSKTKKDWKDGGDSFVRMVKSEEDAINVMWEEANNPAYESSLFMISSSDTAGRAQVNITSVVSAFTVYKSDYNNELDQPETTASLMGWFLKPMWKFAIMYQLSQFFSKKNIFTTNSLTSIYHLPDWIYNRSPIIKWLDYKVIAAPDNLPDLKDENGYFMTWTIAEEYLKWNVSDIFTGVNAPFVWTQTQNKEVDMPLDEFNTKYPGWTRTTIDWKDYISLSGQNYEIIKEWEKEKVVFFVNETKTWLKLYKDWVLLWINVYRNQFTPVYMKRKDRSRHHYIIWKSGWWKSVYISALARQDVWNWDGLCVIDPHGDLVEDILQYIPKERAKDVIYFDAWNEERPMWLNLYEIHSVNEADRVVNDATEIFLKMFWPEIFGPRIQEYFKYWSLTLLEDLDDWATLLDVPRIFTDEVFREYKTKKVKNPVVKNFWERTYASMWEREKQEIIPYFSSKFVSFNTNSLIRNIIGQTKSAFNFRESMDSWKILLINLSKWKIWELNSQLLWMVLVSQIYNWAMSRADTPEEKRRDFWLYVDEFQNYVSGTFADILSEARKYHLWLVMAHQYIAQLEGWKGSNLWESKWWASSVKDAVFWNVGTMQSFKVWAPDAEFLEKEYAPVLSAQDIIGISNYKVYIKENINNATSRVFSMDTIWTEDYKNTKVPAILKEYCWKKYGRKREFVQAEIEARLGIMAGWEETPAADWSLDLSAWVAPGADTTAPVQAPADTTATQ